MIVNEQAQTTLKKLGYYNGAIDGDIGPQSKAAIKLFQRDFGLGVDGIIGPQQTEPALLRCEAKLEHAPEGFLQARRWRLTYYYIEEETTSDSTSRTVPIFDTNGDVIARSSARFFGMTSLNGTGRLSDGRLINVTGKYVSVAADVFEPVRQFALRNNWSGKRYAYAGIRVRDDKVYEAFAFKVIPENRKGNGYGIQRGGIALDPFRTVAADIGAYGTSEPRFRGKGGLVPVGTKVWVMELAGMTLPDGSTHDGWVVVNDTGGAIYGAHFDLFVGTRSLVAKTPVPGKGHVWFEGIEERIPSTYDYGI